MREGNVWNRMLQCFVCVYVYISPLQVGSWKAILSLVLLCLFEVFVESPLKLAHIWVKAADEVSFYLLRIALFWNVGKSYLVESENQGTDCQAGKLMFSQKYMWCALGICWTLGVEGVQIYSGGRLLPSLVERGPFYLIPCFLLSPLTPPKVGNSLSCSTRTFLS